MVRIKITSKQTNGSAIINAEKKIIVFFIGGAGDKNSYYGYGPTKLVKNSIYLQRDTFIGVSLLETVIFWT